MIVQHDPFARGGYSRTTWVRDNRRPCSWCGSTRNRMYSYSWVDDSCGIRLQELAGIPRQFCCLDCFEAYNG